MGHSVQLVIGRGKAVDSFVRRWSARAVQLSGEWRAVPLADDLWDAISEGAPDAPSAELDLAPPGIERALEDATRAGGALAFVSTDYHGGMGQQSAVACVDGRLQEPTRSRGPGPINAALRAIGVERKGEMDEFDTVGLADRRSMSDYEQEIPPAPPKPATPKPARKEYLPVWAVLAIAAAAIAIGVWASLR